MKNCEKLINATEVVELIEETKNELERPMPDYEAISHKLGEELERVEIEYERTQRELAEAQKELTVLRTIKATAEAFLGREI